ncbi:unnamed protein product [[Candida] boidinii]|nr:unnamed protein product [[Candida] boidinii]
MPLDLQLHRIQNLLKYIGNPQKSTWKAIHVAGTNGKGSVCAYISNILTNSKIKTGRFTSPHLITRNDSITIDGTPVPYEKFIEIENNIKAKNQEFKTGCTEFELLTCTAFELFKLYQVEIAVIEVGLGGRLDATNILEPFNKEANESNGVLVTAITKIAMDHEKILGDTLSKIAFEKAGIIKEAIPCVIDGSNDEEVLKMVEKISKDLNSKLYKVKNDENYRFGDVLGFLKDYKSPLLGDYQRFNLSIALKVIEIINSQNLLNNSTIINKKDAINGVLGVKWPGRLQELEITISKDFKKLPVLIDGAHNIQAANELSKCVDHIRSSESATTTVSESNSDILFIIGLTEGKNINGMFDKLIKRNDTVIISKFNEGIDGMPWIKPKNTISIRDELKKLTGNLIIESNIEKALEKAYSLNSDLKFKKIVICGSLYLAADILRINNKYAN